MDQTQENKLVRDLAELIRIRDADGISIKPIVCVTDIPFDRAEYAAKRILYELKRSSIDGLVLDK